MIRNTEARGRPCRSPGSNLRFGLKLVYWGPGRGGKTTNLEALERRLRPELRGRLRTLAAAGERTLYFDCLPLEVPAAGGGRIDLRLYTVPGQRRMARIRRLILHGIDGLVFVWDSQTRRREENLYSLLEARRAIEAAGYDWGRLARVIQFNKQDLEGIDPPERIGRLLDRIGEEAPRIGAVAIRGVHVLETLASVCRRALPRARRLGPARPALSPPPPLC